MELLASVMVTEMFHMLKHGETFNEQRYVAALHALPELPWDDEEE